MQKISTVAAISQEMCIRCAVLIVRTRRRLQLDKAEAILQSFNLQKQAFPKLQVVDGLQSKFLRESVFLRFTGQSRFGSEKPRQRFILSYSTSLLCGLLHQAAGWVFQHPNELLVCSNLQPLLYRPFTICNLNNLASSILPSVAPVHSKSVLLKVRIDPDTLSIPHY